MILKRMSLVLLLAATLSVQAHEGEPHDEPPAAPAQAPPGTPIVLAKEMQFSLGLRTVLAQEKQMTRQIRATGQIIPNPKGAAEVYASHQGKIVSRSPIVAGQWVYQGQTLAVVEEVFHSLERLQVRTDLVKLNSDLAQTRLEVDLAHQDIRLAQAVAKLNRENLERLQRISAVIAKKDIPAAELDYAKAQAQVARARSTLKRTQVRLRELQKERTYFQDLVTKGGQALHTFALKAPIAGVVTLSQLRTGKQVGTQDKLAEILDPSTVWLEANVFENDLALLDKIKTAVAQVSAYPDIKWHGRLVFVGDVVDEQTRTVKATFEIANPGRRLKIGMFANVGLNTAEPVRQIGVPAAAVYEKGGKSWVFVHTRPEEFVQREVEVGDTVNQWTVVRRGIRPGERVVTAGTRQLALGALGK